eukprot:CAMPEP_0184523862 /NCGR_PEP_ID=MMETSP0198_2-20121128/9148_1 /TAXON_ID=1112570 /ORGANISM="Thraustochytrium sp., Strain LLF1b" /LENGTH=75 /DNA_ID=CAMNT_0026914997 /DNA_START=195 /DNA_END=422 /DNA_ORIENTATION=+
MGGGNAMKSAMKRAKNAEKAGKGKKSGGSDKQPVAKVCKICRQTFVSTVRKAELEVHVNNKHAKNVYADCFTDDA